jgi:flagellar biosynthesis protein FlhA
VLALEPGAAQRLLTRLAEAAEPFALRGLQPVLLCSGAIRPHLRRFLERFLPSLAVLAPGEIPSSVKVTSLGIVRLDEANEGGDAPQAVFNVPRRGGAALEGAA